MNLSELFPEEYRHAVQTLGLDWPAEAKACRFGDYTAYGPRDGSPSYLFVSNGDQVGALIQRNSFTVFENDLLILSLRDNDDQPGIDELSYEVRDNGSRLTIIDRDFDGQADLKFTGGPDGKQWRWYRDAWRELDLFNGPAPNRILIDGTWWNYEVSNGELRLVSIYDEGDA